MLTDRMMLPEQAEAVMESAMADLAHLVKDYKITWDSPSDGYPNMMYPILWMIVKPIALKWIERNIPQAFFKPMFETEDYPL